ncbi:hypothetical protein [Pseudosulfitobacter sp. SM2401]|uniref:hypothetical protein n=1 Tax=Pseudosulfitobacter sp. SM2401 TaxID=3350098 RepID=UPI0036F433DA
MRRIAAIACLILPTIGGAEEAWTKLDEAGIHAALDDQKLIYQSADQTFYVSGKTLYNQDGHASWGVWRVQSDQYCSQWPPNDLWACFDLEKQGDQVRFVGFNGDITVADYAE